MSVSQPFRDCDAAGGRRRSYIPNASLMSLIKSKKRVADHGEVFTPPSMVEAMLNLVKDETERIDSRFLEPACGGGNFLVQILRRKLAAVQIKYGKSDFERRHYALLALMCIYGIELLVDNIAGCRANLLEISPTI
jgi:type I restriction-modification system DNA methylase subunit